MTPDEQYAFGYADGLQAGRYAARFSPALVHNEIAEKRQEVRRAREGREGTLYHRRQYPERYEQARAWQAYSVGHARGYREACHYNTEKGDN